MLGSAREAFERVVAADLHARPGLASALAGAGSARGILARLERAGIDAAAPGRALVFIDGAELLPELIAAAGPPAPEGGCKFAFAADSLAWDP
ncbi:MAG: hypothetical protein HUK26_09210, partial [Duodenibacillus sp.]|nr:hypothetical protein [Duodenibacillus sp.]